LGTWTSLHAHRRDGGALDSTEETKSNDKKKEEKKKQKDHHIREGTGETRKHWGTQAKGRRGDTQMVKKGRTRPQSRKTGTTRDGLSATSLKCKKSQREGQEG